MIYSIKPVPTFQTQFKRLLKKYKSLTQDILDLQTILLQDPKHGTSLGKNCFKIKMSISSKNKGKSGGARVITHLQIVGETIYLLSIYDKSQKENLDEDELDNLLLEIIE